MASKVLELDSILRPDQLGTRITEKFMEWDMMRQLKKLDWEEVARYVYATDTRSTSNSSLPWKNSTTIPKLCQIYDNLLANYMATMFPKRKNLTYEANEKNSDSANKRDAALNYTLWMVDQPSFKEEMQKALSDWVLKGNCFLMPVWVDERVETPLGTKAGYIGPAASRINPIDIVMNPTTPSFRNSPKIIKSLLSIGEVKKMLNQLSNDDTREDMEEMWKYMQEIRSQAANYMGDWVERDNLYAMDGFGSFRQYLNSDICEVLTFYGDIYDIDTEELLENHMIMVIDRHKVICKKPNPSFFGTAPIFHSAWRPRPDNLWGMGPLDNLVGMQYRMDHVENMKADIYDLVTYPVQMITGFVEDYVWQPGEKIFASEEGKVELVTPDVQALQANFEIQNLERMMEEMAGAPKEAMGFRTPGEKTKYEVQRLENAASRIFQSKTRQFEEQVLEPLLNAMLEMARRNLTGTTVIKVFDDEFRVASFQSLTVEDITGIGRIKPVASRHFAEQAELIQNLTGLTNSPLWATIQPHVSAIGLSRIVEDAFNLKDFEIFIPNIALAEQAESQKMMQSLQEQVGQQTMTASGMGQDFDMSELSAMGAPGMEQQAPPEGAAPTEEAPV